MATLVDPDFRARLAALGDKYAAGVPALMASIAEALAGCRRDGLTAAHLAALHKVLHTVAGSAGTFGFGALGTACRGIEQRVKPLMAEAEGGEGLAADAAGAWPALADDLDALLRWAAIDARAAQYVPPPP